MLDTSKQAKLDTLWKTLSNDGLKDSFELLEQISYLIYLKKLNEIQLRKESFAEVFETEVSNPIFTDENINCRWTVFSIFSEDRMHRNMIDKVFPFLKSLNAEDDCYYSRFMEQAVFKIKSGAALKTAVQIISEFDFNDADLAHEVYDYLLSKLGSTGHLSQFRTPAQITELVIKLMQPSINDSICDPCAGTAGYLIPAAKSVAENYRQELLNKDTKAIYDTTMFSGYDISRSMLSIAAMNMILNGIQMPNIKQLDSLSFENEDIDKYSLIMSTPPIDRSTDSKMVSSTLQIGEHTNNNALLFYRLAMRMLAPNGKCALVLPDAFAFGVSKAHQSVKEDLLKRKNLEAVISLPDNSFFPHSTAACCIVIFSKRLPEENHKVWLCKMEDFNKIDEVVERFHNLDEEETRERTDWSFFVNPQEILDNNKNMLFARYSAVDGSGIQESLPAMLSDLEIMNNTLNSSIDELIGGINNG